MTYLTDGVHLYEKISWCQNFDLTGGGWLTVRDCRTGNVRAMCQLELALCESIPEAPVVSVSTNNTAPPAAAFHALRRGAPSGGQPDERP